MKLGSFGFEICICSFLARWLVGKSLSPKDRSWASTERPQARPPPSRWEEHFEAQGRGKVPGHLRGPDFTGLKLPFGYKEEELLLLPRAGLLSFLLLKMFKHSFSLLFAWLGQG